MPDGSHEQKVPGSRSVGNRVELTLEEAGKPGAGIVSHLAPSSARRVRAALALALRELGEPVD